MAELEKSADVTAKASAKKRLAPKIITKVDTTPTDVLQWSQEGRELYFEGDEEFLELPTEVYKILPISSKRRYDIVKAHTEGKDVISDATPEAWNLPFNVRPDEANRQLAVHGKKANMDYHWGRLDKLGTHQSEGWEVDHDSNVRTEYAESCDYKTVGGQNSPEAVLLRRPKEVSTQKRKERKELRDASVKKTQNNYREQISQAGLKPVVSSDNG